VNTTSTLASAREAQLAHVADVELDALGQGRTRVGVEVDADAARAAHVVQELAVAAADVEHGGALGDPGLQADLDHRAPDLGLRGPVGLAEAVPVDALDVLAVDRGAPAPSGAPSSSCGPCLPWVRGRVSVAGGVP
jgi:hypothetical protein